MSFAIALFGLARARDALRASKAALSILLLALPGLAAARPEPGEIVVPSQTCRGVFVVPLTLGSDEDEPLRMLLDTGSAWTLADPGSLRRVTGVGAGAGKVSLPRARLGPHELGGLQVLALPMGRLSRAFRCELDGILGFPAFRDVLLTLDYPAQQVRVSHGRLPRPDGREIFRVSGARRPHVTAEIGGRRFRLLLDSGSTGRFQLRSARGLRWSTRPRPAASVVTVGSFRIIDGARIDGAARLGPLRFEDPVVTLGHDENQVGWHVLRHFVLTFDQRNDRLRMRTSGRQTVHMPPITGTGVAYSPRPEGLRVERAFPGSSVQAAGLREGDLIVAIDGVPVHERATRAAGDEPAGVQHVFTYVRDGVRAEAVVTTEVLVP